MALKDQATVLEFDATYASGDVQDTQGYYAATVVLPVINTSTVTFLEDDAVGMASATAVDVDNLIIGDGAGTKALNVVSYTAAGTAWIGYVGKKRYVKATVANPATDTTIVIVLGEPMKAPVA